MKKNIWKGTKLHVAVVLNYNWPRANYELLVSVWIFWSLLKKIHLIERCFDLLHVLLAKHALLNPVIYWPSIESCHFYHTKCSLYIDEIKTIRHGKIALVHSCIFGEHSVLPWFSKLKCPIYDRINEINRKKCVSANVKHVKCCLTFSSRH
jgi:hypothetical protein